MGWSVGYDTTWHRDVGYMVPAVCDYPGCGKYIDRGLGFVCGSQPLGGDQGCGLYFCFSHLVLHPHSLNQEVCERCLEGKEPFEPTPDVEEWTNHKMTDPSWAQWREENGYN